jgi:hypothetical protein
MRRRIGSTTETVQPSGPHVTVGVPTSFEMRNSPRPPSERPGGSEIRSANPPPLSVTESNGKAPGQSIRTLIVPPGPCRTALPINSDSAKANASKSAR